MWHNCYDMVGRMRRKRRMLRQGTMKKRRVGIKGEQRNGMGGGGGLWRMRRLMMK